MLNGHATLCTCVACLFSGVRTKDHRT